MSRSPIFICSGARGVLAFLVLGGLVVGCTAPGGPDRIKTGFNTSDTIDAASPPPPPSGDDASMPLSMPLSCKELSSSEKLIPRSTITTGVERPVMTTQQYLTSDLFRLFKTVCGGCHVESSYGGFGVDANTFSTKVDQKVLDIIKSPDEKVYMPPPPKGIPFADRPPTDVVVQLYDLLQTWLSKGRPDFSFDLPATTDTQPVIGYAIDPTTASQMSNLGTCLPHGTIGTDTSPMDALDTFFAGTSTLPTTLDQTDLTTLDSEQLAREGVISFAPTYPLWTDDAGKMRYVRVPRGQSIKFDKATQKFTIPPNTRFYKTFLKAVIDANGSSGYKKIETRLIVSRPDTNLPDGTAKQNALYGTYLWNEDESQAILVTDPLRSGEPFADRIFTYVTDEPKAAMILASNPNDPQHALSDAGVVRHYAVPGALRCVQCHEGSPSESFVLGFTPLQLSRRPGGTGGIYTDPPSDAELTQVQRLIDYGVISGMASPADVLPLEKAEGSRLPRNDYELKAQAYMVGNCSHCHNPRGLPSIKQPLVKGVLNFLPGPGANEGVFQFPLEVVSPIRKRGAFQDVEIPYITPSLYDISQAGALAKFFCPTRERGSCFVPPGQDLTADATPQFILAPWRSLIYRNVDTPNDYFDDWAAYPHMPLNSPGYDCRVAPIMGQWMASIPARLKDPRHRDDALPGRDPSTGTFVFGDRANTDPQPYVEVKPDDPEYKSYVDEAAIRLDKYRHGHRYDFCPTTYTADTVDPIIEEATAENRPVDFDVGQFYTSSDHKTILMPELTPIRPNYVTFDDTDPPGDWVPRRIDWVRALVNPNIAEFIAYEMEADFLTPSAAEDLANVVSALTTVKISDERDLLLKEIPYGLWDTKPAGCNFAGQPTVASFTGAQRPPWMDKVNPDPAAPVFTQLPGAAVFTTICFNCHGLNADSKGLLSDEITNLTGGAARVANFRDGLFGPLSQPGENRARVFADAAKMLGGGLTTDDLGARYMAWMALGGTEKHLPDPVLRQVSQAPVLGQLRHNIDTAGTPDMLRLGLNLCQHIATSDPNVKSLPMSDLINDGSYDWQRYTGLVDANADAEMWLQLCNLKNRKIVRVLPIGQWSKDTSASDLQLQGTSLYWATGENGEDLYGANPIMDHHGNVTMGIQDDNYVPVCAPKPSAAADLATATAVLASLPVRKTKKVIPFCPDGFVTPAHRLQVDTSGETHYIDGKRWAARGAINAALAVFLYLDQIEHDPTKRKPLYNQCNLLGKSP